MMWSFILIIIVAVIAAVVITELFLNFGATNTQQADINSSFVSIGASNCIQCSNGIANFMYSLLSSQGYSNSRVSLNFGSNTADKIISTNLIASLPSVIIPSTASSANLLDALVYLNIFNLGSNDFVLNTPFLSGLVRNITYYSIIQNRTITSYDVYNASAVYNVGPRSKLLNLINPSEFLLQTNYSNMTSSDKIDIEFIYDNSPFSAVQSVVLKTALDNFGNFTSQHIMQSRTVNISSNQSLGPDILYVLGNMPFDSKYFDLYAYNLSSVGNETAQKNLFEYDQNALSSINSVYGSFTPFLDIGGKFIGVSSMLKPSVFNGLNTTRIQSLIASNSTVGEAFNDSVAFLEAALCSFSEVTSSVCNTTAVKLQELNILRQI
ncbi:MAG: hypothetical protein M1433_03160 [Candidatus Parvarchaeota archaeon]|nr:hypothetical protein [Candidatus Parvarchaeota archaeon]